MFKWIVQFHFKTKRNFRCSFTFWPIGWSIHWSTHKIEVKVHRKSLKHKQNSISRVIESQHSLMLIFANLLWGQSFHIRLKEFSRFIHSKFCRTSKTSSANAERQMTTTTIKVLWFLMQCEKRKLSTSLANIKSLN